jgi:hypothetical protein
MSQPCASRGPGSFLYNGTRSLFEKAGISYGGPKENHCVMRRTVSPGYAQRHGAEMHALHA